MKIIILLKLFCVLSLGLCAKTYPKYILTNDNLSVTYLLPDSVNGYYRSSRFDWGSMLAQIEYKDCTYLQDWRGYSGRPPVGEHNPKFPNTGTGLAEEFNDPQGYYDKDNNGYFVKIGVGLLKKKDNSSYDPAKYYDIIDIGERKVVFNNNIKVTHHLKTEIGYHYVLEREYLLENNKLIVNHTLKNLGTKSIKTKMFSHNFFQFNYRPIDSNYVLRFLNSKIVMPENYKWINKNRIRIGHNELYVNHAMNDFSPSFGNIELTPKNGNFVFFNYDNNMSVTVTSTEPIFALGLWFWQNAFCPEMLTMIEVSPQNEFSWSFEYSFIPLK